MSSKIVPRLSCMLANDVLLCSLEGSLEMNIFKDPSLKLRACAANASQVDSHDCLGGKIRQAILNVAIGKVQRRPDMDIPHRY